MRARWIVDPSTAILFFTILANASTVSAAVVERVGGELQVNAYTSSYQDQAAIGFDADRDFVVVWNSVGQDGEFPGVFGRRFDSAGVAQASEFQINTVTSHNQSYPSIAVRPAGDFVVTWRSYQQDGAAFGVFARRFDSAGGPLGVEMLVNTHTQSTQRPGGVAFDGDGDFVVVWDDSEGDGASYGVFARRYDSAGEAQGGAIQVNTYVTSFQLAPAVVMRADGAFVIAWQSFGQDGEFAGIFAQRFDSAGAPAGAELQVNSYTSFSQLAPAIGMDTEGDFVVAWRSDQQDGAQAGVFARRFDSAGIGLAAEFQVAAYTSDVQSYPSIAVESDGDFVVVWHSNVQDGSSYGVFARGFDAAGTPTTGEIAVNLTTENLQARPAVTLDGGAFVVAWTSDEQDGDKTGIFAQRFRKLAVLDADGNGVVTPLTDGVLVLRYLFGFAGATLTDGAVGPGCTRCDGASIAEYLAGQV